MTELVLEEMNKAKPSLPDELLQFPLDEIDIFDFPVKLEELWGEIMDELMSFQWSAHNIATYNRGCRGPLCRKSRREDARRKRDEDSARLMTYARMDPIIEYYHLIAKMRLSNYRRERLSVIQAG